MLVKISKLKSCILGSCISRNDDWLLWNVTDKPISSVWHLCHNRLTLYFLFVAGASVSSPVSAWIIHHGQSRLFNHCDAGNRHNIQVFVAFVFQAFKNRVIERFTVWMSYLFNKFLTKWGLVHFTVIRLDQLYTARHATRITKEKYFIN